MPDERAITTAASQSDLRERIDGALRPIFGDYVWFGQVVDAVAPLVESEAARVAREEHDRLRHQMHVEIQRYRMGNWDDEQMIAALLALLGESTQEQPHA